ncbi:MAG: porin [Pseudomonadota bacterium]
MKKVLLASTMLIATGSMAAAEVTFNGLARFGLKYEGNAGAAAEETYLEQRFRLNVRGTVETDGGVEFSARMRIETNDNGSEGEGESAEARAPEFSVEAGGFRLDVGNTSDVLDSGDVVDFYGYGVGLTSFLEQSSGWGGQIPASGIAGSAQVNPTIKARYAVGDFTVAASYTDDADEDGLGSARSDEWQLGAGYKFGDYAVGAAFGSTDTATGDNDFWAASFGGTVGTVGFSVLVGDSDAQDDTSVGASVVIPVGAATDIRIAASDNGVDGTDTAYGIGFRHSLGGGVSLRGGFGENNAGYGVGDLGVTFDF